MVEKPWGRGRFEKSGAVVACGRGGDSKSLANKTKSKRTSGTKSGRN